MTVDPVFRAAVAVTLVHEGGFQNDPADPGNWTGGHIGDGDLKGTKFGISAHEYPALDIANLTEDEATALYFTDYWLPFHFGQLPASVAGKAFDMGVDLGPETSIKLLQQAIAKAGETCDADGIIGPQTADAARCCDPVALLTDYRALIAVYYQSIVASDPRQQKFLAGWLARAAA